jgi:hypothetical protein
MNRVFLSAIFMLLTLAGCVFPAEYPQDFPRRVVADDGCPTLSGTYFMKASIRQAFGIEEEREFMALLFVDDTFRQKSETQQRQWYLQIPKAADRMRLKFGADRILRVELISEQKIVALAEYSEAKGQIECKKDGATLQSVLGGTRGQGNPLVGVEGGYVQLFKAEDGTLIAYSFHYGVGMVFLVLPFAGGEGTWIRWPVVNPNMPMPPIVGTSSN